MEEEGQRPSLSFSIENILREDFPNPSRISKRPYPWPEDYRRVLTPVPCYSCFTVRYGPATPVYHPEICVSTKHGKANFIENERKPLKAFKGTSNKRQCKPASTETTEGKGEIAPPTVEPPANQESTTNTSNSPKPAEKKKRFRSHFSQVQLQYLESIFSRQHYLSRDERTLLASALEMTELQVRNWFQNKRYQKRHREIQALQKLGKQVPVKILVSEGKGPGVTDNTESLPTKS